MNNTPVYKVIELSARNSSIEGAINLAISTASRSLRNLEWYKVISITGNIRDNKPENFQVTLNIGFRLDECMNKQSSINHHVAPKQVILSESPAKEEQKDFIAEGGNSQPLTKPGE